MYHTTPLPAHHLIFQTHSRWFIVLYAFCNYRLPTLRHGYKRLLSLDERVPRYVPQWHTFCCQKSAQGMRTCRLQLKLHPNLHFAAAITQKLRARVVQQLVHRGVRLCARQAHHHRLARTLGVGLARTPARYRPVQPAGSHASALYRELSSCAFNVSRVTPAVHAHAQACIALVVQRVH